MKIISLWEPWAVLWAGGKKKIETRGKNWLASYELPLWIAVHAAKRFTSEEVDCCAVEPFRSALAALGYERVGEVPLGCVVGIVRVVRVYQFSPRDPTPPSPELDFGGFDHGRYGFVTDRNLLFAEPIPLTGQRGVWDWARPAEARMADRIGPEGRRHGAIAIRSKAQRERAKGTLFEKLGAIKERPNDRDDGA